MARQLNAIFPSDDLPSATERLSLSSDVLDHTLAFAYDYLAARRYDDAARLCRSILVADPHYWWCYSLYAAVLRKQGKLREALAMINQSLRYEPSDPKLLSAKAAIQRELDIQVANAQRVLCDERAPRFNQIAHQG